ncbi:MAG: CRISPR-associated helicase/endonuclease Cas3 [Candidatus Nitrosoglobus sp.]
MLKNYWGKAQGNADNGENSCHPFAYHSLDVAAVASVWLTNSRFLKRAFGCVDGDVAQCFRAWILFFISLHDLGKLDLRFQAKAPEAIRVLGTYNPYPESLWLRIPTQNYRHGPEGFRWGMTELPDYIGFDQNDENTWYEYAEVWRPWLSAVTGHHGILPEAVDKPNVANIPKEIREVDHSARREWVKSLEELFLYPAGLSLRDSPPAVSPLLAGFCAVCDWLGSNSDSRYFPYQSWKDDWLVYWENRQGNAARLLHDSGICRAPLVQGGMSTVFPTLASRQVQTLVNDLPCEAGLTLIEAPTGSGKTEAALAYASRLLAAGLADSIVFALPTQATANAMLKRLETIASVLFPGGDANLVLAHGKARYNPDFITLQEVVRPHTAQAHEEALVQCAEWLAQSRKRVFLGQIGVCTVDQVLISVLPVKHKFVRGFGIGKSVLIIDEVHAYDSYMYGLLAAVLEQQQTAGGSAILLSATLPYQQRQQLANTWQPKAALEMQAPYPLITHLGSGSASVPQTWELAAAEMPRLRTVGLNCVRLPDAFPDTALYHQLIAAASVGAQVAVICNLVDDAQRLARQLRAQTDIPVDLFHARFRFCDRLAKEQQVLGQYSKEAPRDQGRILVATQVIEQSLDLDFDWLVTQLCPVDLLFQRLGRLHRHPRTRPKDYSKPCCTVLLPEAADYGLHGVIYANHRVLWRTEQRLQRSSGHVIFPGAYRDWIEAVYAEEDWPDEPENILQAYFNFMGEQMAQSQEARRLVSTRMEPFKDEDNEIRALTRDGEQRLNVLPVRETADGLTLLDGGLLDHLSEWEKAEVLNQQTVAVSCRWNKWLPSADDTGLHILVMRPIKEGIWEAFLESNRLRYSQEFGLERTLGEEPSA